MAQEDKDGGVMMKDLSTSKNEPEKEDVTMADAENQDNDDSFAELDQEKVQKCSNLIYKITINNSKEGNPAVKFKIRFSAKDDKEQINLQWPRSGVKGQARNSDRD